MRVARAVPALLIWVLELGAAVDRPAPGQRRSGPVRAPAQLSVSALQAPVQVAVGEREAAETDVRGRRVSLRVSPRS